MHNEKSNTGRPLRVTVVTKSGSLAGGANTYEAAVIRVLSELEEGGSVELSVLVPAEVPGAEGDVEQQSSRHYPNSVLSKVRSLIASTPVGRLIATVFPLSPLQRSLKSLTPDLVYFPSPNIHAMGVYKYPYVFTVWDLGHRELRQFPEFANPVEYFLRERLYRKAFSRASSILTDSMWTGHRLEEIYGLSADRWLSLGMAFTVSVPTNVKSIDVNGPYFLYPAQRWPHKNHRTLLEAFAQVVKVRPDAKLVLIGSSKGGGVDLESWIGELGIANNVMDLGFVDSSTTFGLIAGAQAVVMPTYLGPTNLPPIEAASLGVRSIVSDVHHFDEPISDYLLPVPASEPHRWTDAMFAIFSATSPARWRGEPDVTEKLEAVLSVFDPAKGT